MPATVNVGQSISSNVPTESNAAGAVAIVPGNMVWTINSDSPNPLVSFKTNSDGSATFSALSPGVVQVTVTDSVFNISFTDSLTVAGSAAPTAITFTWGTPAKS